MMGAGASTSTCGANVMDSRVRSVYNSTVGRLFDSGADTGLVELESGEIKPFKYREDGEKFFYGLLLWMPFVF